MTDTKLYELLEDSRPTYQRIFKGTQRKLKRLAEADGRTVPYYLAKLADREFDKQHWEAKQ